MDNTLIHGATTPRAISSFDWLNHPMYHFFVGHYIVDACSNVVALDMSTIWHWLALGGGAFLGWALADVISYGIHMFIDSPFFDRVLAKRTADGINGGTYAIIDEHHTKPMNYSQLTDTELVFITYTAAIPAILGLRVADVWWLDAQNHLYVSFRFFLIASALIMNHAHKWAHERAHGSDLNVVIRKLQDWNILLNPAHHQPHHKTLSSHYSLYNGFTQLFLDKHMPILTPQTSAVEKLMQQKTLVKSQ